MSRIISTEVAPHDSVRETGHLRYRFNYHNQTVSIWTCHCFRRLVVIFRSWTLKSPHGTLRTNLGLYLHSARPRVIDINTPVLKARDGSISSEYYYYSTSTLANR